MNKTQFFAEQARGRLYPCWPDMEKLPTRGPRGGNNANTVWAYRARWRQSPGCLASKVARQIGIPTLPYWHGSNPTPGTALPKIAVRVFEDLEREWREKEGGK